MASAEQKQPNGSMCPLGIQNRERVLALESRVRSIEGAVLEMRDKLLGRLPNWATLLVSVMMATIAALIAILAK